MNLNEQLSKLVKDKFHEEIHKLPLSSISYLKNGGKTVRLSKGR